MDRQEIIKKFETEVAVQKERLANAKKSISELCTQLGLDPATVKIGDVESKIESQNKTLKDLENQLDTLVSEYETIDE